MAFPNDPIYINDAQQPIFWLDGANVGERMGRTPRYLVIHHTAGTDSRAYLQKNNRGVSCHYLVGLYGDASINPRVYKFASETTKITYTQGFSSIGPVNDPNPWAISIEMEGPPINDNVIDETATLAASIIRYWRQKSVELLLVGHKHIDRTGKVDPALDWCAFCKTVYSRM